MRPVYRYIVVASAQGDSELLSRALVEAVKELWGVAGLAAVDPVVVHLEWERGAAVVRVRREGLAYFRAAVAAHPEPVVRVVKVAGTLRKAVRIARSLPPPLPPPRPAN